MTLIFKSIPQIQRRSYRAIGQPLLGRFNQIPVDLFRINASDKVILRDYLAQKKKGRESFDVKVGDDGLVHPKPGDTFEEANGASVRPHGPFLAEVVRGFRGKNTTIYRLPKGVQLPSNLVLLHEHTDHHSIQCSEPMTLRQLNKTITDFCKEHGETLTKQEFVERFP